MCVRGVWGVCECVRGVCVWVGVGGGVVQELLLL